MKCEACFCNVSLEFKDIGHNKVLCVGCHSDLKRLGYCPKYKKAPTPPMSKPSEKAMLRARDLMFKMVGDVSISRQLIALDMDAFAAEALSEHKRVLELYKEYYEASEAVQKGLIGFELHNAAVDRLDAAQAAIAELKTNEKLG